MVNDAQIKEIVLSKRITNVGHTFKDNGPIVATTYSSIPYRQSNIERRFQHVACFPKLKRYTYSAAVFIPLLIRNYKVSHKITFLSTIATFTFVLFGAVSFAQEESVKRTLPANPPAWARNAEGFAVSMAEQDGTDAVHIIHKTPTDWAVRIPQTIDVKPGDIFTLKSKIKNVGGSSCETGVALYDAQGEAISWSYGGAKIPRNNEWTETTTKFAVPKSVVKIEPRIIGFGASDVYVANYEIESAGRVEKSPIVGTLPAENKFLRLVFHMEDASFTIKDVRTGRVWSQRVSGTTPFVTGAQPVERGMLFHLLDPCSLVQYDALIKVEKDAPEVVVKITADPQLELNSPISYPYPFQSKTTDRIVLPVNEGISFPATEQAHNVERTHTYGGHGLCMAFWAIVDDSIDPDKSSGLMGIFETPDDAGIDVKLGIPDPADKNAVQNNTQTLAIGTYWEPSRHTFRYERTLRVAALEKGGYVAVCKRYQKYAKQIGLHRTFDEKIKNNPNLAQGLDLLIGAANIWCWDEKGTNMVPELKKAGFDHILWSGGGNPQELDKLNAEEGVLTSRYDIYQDIMDPARYDELPHVHGDWIPEAWPQDLAWNSLNPEDWTRGWEVDPKDPSKPRIPCGVLCDTQAVKYAKERIGKELVNSKYRARFIDTTTASPWRECWNPDHPMSRTDSKVARMNLLELLGKEFDLVCGCETGIDASVPYCDFYEGMMSLGPFRCPESGRYIDRIWDEVPEDVEKYQLGEQYRLPLFELVYHGCVVSYWYWGDHNDKFPKMWRKRDLFNALYGVPPMYGFKKAFFEENFDRFADSYKIAEPVARLTGKSEMLDHRFLTQDRSVQKTVFANGVESIVNFGKEDFRLPDGTIVPAESFKIVQNKQ